MKKESVGSNKQEREVVSSHNVVIDHGTSTCKAGFSTEDSPQCILPTVVGHGRHKGAMESLGLKESYVGSKAQALRGILSITQPIRQGVVQNWDDLEIIWDHIYSNELCVAPSDLPSLVTIPPLMSQEDEATLTEIMMEKLQLPAMYKANKSVMALYGGGQMTGISVDSGHDTTYIVPAHQGKPIQDATLVLKMGGKHITEQLMNQLLNGKYSFPDDNFLLWRKKKKSKFTVSSKKEIIREMKEQYCFVSSNYKESFGDPDFPEESVRLPDGNMIVMGKEKFMAPEIMFQPSLANKKTCGIGELLYYSLLKCPESLHQELLSNITLSGGNSKFSLMEKRLASELSRFLPPSTWENNKSITKVKALPNRELLGWIGGARLSNLSSFQRFWLTKADYLESGQNSSEEMRNGEAETVAAKNVIRNSLSQLSSASG